MSNDQPPYGSGPNPHGDPGEEPTRHVTRPPQQTPPGQGQAPGQPQQYGGAAYGSQGGYGNQDPGNYPGGTGYGPSGPGGPGYGPSGPGGPGYGPSGPGGPGYGPDGPGGPGYGPGGPGEPPKQSRAGLFAIIGVVLLLIVGVAVALVLTLGGDDDSSDDKSKEDESSKTEDPTPTESAEPTESSEPTGDTISGSSYTFTVPDGWSDVTSEVSGQQASVDSAIAAGSSISGSNANIIVEAGPAGGETDPEAARATWKSNLETSTGSTARDIGNGEIGGTEAIGVRLERTNEGGVDIVQIGYLTIKNDSVVAVTISSTTDNEDAAMEKFEEVSDSWDWQ